MRTKMESDNRYPTYGVKIPKYLLKSRKSFLKTLPVIDSSINEENIK